MSFPRYPKYRPSGVEWLGEVPDHWDAERMKHACHSFPSNIDKKTLDGEEAVLSPSPLLIQLCESRPGSRFLGLSYRQSF